MVKILLSAIVFILGTSNIALGAQILGANDRGSYLGRHYFEIYVDPQGANLNLDALAYFDCNEQLYGPLSNSRLYQIEYIGPAGYDNSISQINVSFYQYSYSISTF